MKHRLLCLGLMVSLVSLASLYGQESEFYSKPTNVKEYWRALKFEIAVGKFDVAAQHLKGLLDANPKDADLLELEAKDGLVPFLRLRNVERWSADRKADADIRQNVETLIKMVSAALKNELGNPERIAKFARNLAATPEEAAFALKELTRSGVDAIPVLLDLLRSDQPPALRAAILDALPHFDIAVVPALVAAFDVNDPNLRMELLDSLRKRPDYLSLQSKPETDLIPTLWYFSADVLANPAQLRQKARDQLRGLLERDPDADRDVEHRLPQWQLAQSARRFLDHKARFDTPANVVVWKWDGTKPVAASMSVSDAEEYYGLRYARWAMEIKPEYAEAQKVFLTLAIEKQAGRTGMDMPLVKSAPALYAVLATAPYTLLTDLLDTALIEKRTPVAIAVIQAIGDRHEVKAARPSDRFVASQSSETRPALLMKALDYPDRRVQLAAVDALLKAPGSHTHQRAAQIVKILAGFLLADPPEEGSKPKAMIGDYDRVRADALANVVRQAGFQVEIRRTGKEVVRRLQEKPDIDLVLIDQHLPLPTLPDFLSQIRADFRTRGTPLLVVASPDKPTTAHPITLLGRLAALTAAEEHYDFVRAQTRYYDPQREVPSLRFGARLDKLRQRVAAAGIEISAPVRDRLEYLVFLTTPTEPMGFPLDRPELEKARLLAPSFDRLNRMNSLRNDPHRGHIATNEPPFPNSRERTQALADLVGRLEISLAPEILEIASYYWRIMQSGQVDPTGKVTQLPLPAVAIRYPEIESRLNRLTKSYERIRVIPEVFTDLALKDEMQDFVKLEDAKVLEVEKKGNAKLALEWLRKMAVGELPNYPVGDAEAALRLALQKPELAALAIDAVGRLSSKEAQQDLASVVLGGMAPELRIQAADALIKHIQLRGRMLSAPQQQLLLEKARTEENPQVKARLLAVKGILDAQPKETGARLLGYTPPVSLPKEDGKDEPKEKKDEPKDKND